MRHIKKAQTLFLFLLFLPFCGCSGEERALPREERSASVRVIEVKRGDIASYISATGTLAPRRVSRLGPKVEGRIERIYADEGDFVKKGEPLVKLEEDTFLIAKNEAKAALGTARANLVKAEVNLEKVEKDYKRFSQLYKERVIPEQKYDDTSAAYKSAKAELELAKAKVEEAEANLRMAEQNLKDSVTYAPFSGFIVKKLMEKGEISTWVSYQWEVFHLQDISTVKIECPIAEGKVSFIHLGKEVEIHVDAFPKEIFKGKITTINPKVDAPSRTFIIKVEIPNKDFRLKAGMFARVRIPEEKRAGVLCIPKEALMVKGEEHIVFKVEDGLSKAQPVRLGISDGKHVEVISGLKEGEKVVIEGLYALRDGTKVKVIR